MGQIIQKNIYTRISKSGLKHSYTRSKTIFIFICDNCQQRFERSQGNMNPQRASNVYYHVCADCDSKRFAQKKGVERRKLWKISVDSDVRIDQL